MTEYIILGADFLLSDVFDAIHASGGKVAEVYLNRPELPLRRGQTIAERINAQNYPIKLHTSIDAFRPTPGYRYIQGLNSPKKHILIEALKQRFGLTFDALIHPTAYLGSQVKIGEGVFVNARATIAPNAVLDDFCSVNRSAVVGHDAYIGKYTRIGPAVSLAGGTYIGGNGSIGMGSTLLDYVEVGAWSVIGAGSVVTKDIPEGVVAYGVPAKVIKENTNRM